MSRRRVNAPRSHIGTRVARGVDDRKNAGPSRILARVGPRAPAAPLGPAQYDMGPLVARTGLGTTRDAIHASWNQLAQTEIHWDLGRGGFQAHGPPLTGVPMMPLNFYPATGAQDLHEEMRPGRLNPDGVSFTTWENGPHGVIEAKTPDMNNVNMNAYFPIHDYRANELKSLQERGYIMDTMLQNPQGGYWAQGGQQIEPRWAFCGIANHEHTAPGDAWSVFKYVLSDLVVPEGHMTGVDLSCTLKDILCDILQIGYPIITQDTVITVWFQGEFRNPANYPGTKPWLFYNHGGMTLGQAWLHPENIIEDIADNLIAYQQSDALREFQFYRVYIPCLTTLNINQGGGDLTMLPPAMKQLRESKLYGGKKGYIMINNSDSMCAFYALLAGLANVTTRIKKSCKVMNSIAPEICKRLYNYSTKLEKVQNKGKKIQSEVLLEMQSAIGWKKGEQVTPGELCKITEHLRNLYKIDIGLLIFDAVYPLKNIITSYDTEAKYIPKEKICLVHWKFGNNLEYGHYDCIYATNLTSWIQKGLQNRKRLVFCFRKLKTVHNNQTTEKGDLCVNCNFYEKEIQLKAGKWEDHGLTYNGVVLCQNCRVRFKSEECYQNHLQKSHGLAKTACESRQKCTLCGRVHGDEYDCKTFFCQVCKRKFPSNERKTHICYIQNTSSKMKTPIPNVVYADCEGSRIHGYHTAVCLAVTWKQFCKNHRNRKRCEVCKLGEQEFNVYCTSCLKEFGIDECPDCLKQRKKFFLDNCIEAFLDWLEKRFKKVTVVFHNGGRYDMHLVYNELLKSGKFYIKKEAERGTQIIFMVATLLTEEKRQKSIEIRFIDSFNFITSSLRNFPAMFSEAFKNDTSILNEKGRFPYELLNQNNWIEYKGECPDYPMFGITEQEYKNIEKINVVRKKEIIEILEYIKSEKEKKEPWIALEKIRTYTLQDVYVLAMGCEAFRYHFWNIAKTDPFHWVTLAAAVAGTYRQPQYMLPESIQVFNMEDREWQRQGLRGGRCEPFKLYWKARDKNEEMKIYDINSQYPAAQIYGYVPFGKVSFDETYNPPKAFTNFVGYIRQKYTIDIIQAFLDPTGASGNGFIECEINTAYTHFPLLPYKDPIAKKNLFMVRNGKWIGFISVLAEAIAAKQVLVKTIHRIQFWAKTTDRLFREFIPPIYATKVHSTGWKKSLGLDREPTEEEKKEFIRESNERGIPVQADKMVENAAGRGTAKLMANCGWGYLCQKPHASEILYFDNTSVTELENMGELLINLQTPKDQRRLSNIPKGIGKYTRLKLTKDPLQITAKEMNANIAYHVGGGAPAWGLQLLSRSLLSLHPTQPAYCDTDSVFYIYNPTNPEHKLLETGKYLGEFMDEYPNHRITEYVCIGPKSYYVKLEHRKTGQIEYKGKFKGLPMMSSTFSLLDENKNLASFGMDQMKKILFSACHGDDEKDLGGLCMKFEYTNFFKRSQDLKIRTCEEKKTIQFTFDKRIVIWPKNLDFDNWHEVNTIPICSEDEPLTMDDVQEFWNKFII